MAEDRAAWERRLLNHLTTIKLAIQMLDRRTALSPFQRQLVRRASEAIDSLIGELLDRWAAERGGAAIDGRAAARAEPAALRRMRGAERRRFTAGHAVAAAMLVGVALLGLVLMGVALLVPLLLGLLAGLLLARAAFWPRRR